MNVQLDLDDEVIRLIEYIPKDQLSLILNKLIKEGIHSKSSIQVSQEQQAKNTSEINRVIELMEQFTKQQLTAPVVVEPIIVKEKEVVKEVNTPVLISLTGLDCEDLDEEMMALMK